MSSIDIVADVDGYILGHYACDQDSYVVPGPGLPMRTSYYYNTSEDYAIRRGYAHFDMSDIPSGAIVTAISLKMYTLDTPEAFARDSVSTWVTPLNSWPYAGAYELWTAIWDGSTSSYVTPSWSAAGSHTVSLGSDALLDYEDHSTYLAMGFILDEGAPETGELDFKSSNDSFEHHLPTLTVTYSAGRRRASLVIVS